MPRASLGHPLPCYQPIGFEAIPGECAKRELMTAEEHAARAKEVADAIERFAAALSAGKCPQCGADIEPSTVVRRCRYAACGHRLGQAAR